MPKPAKKLTDEQALDIRRSYKYREVTVQHLADKHGVSRTVVNDILDGMTYTHISTEVPGKQLRESIWVKGKLR